MEKSIRFCIVLLILLVAVTIVTEATEKTTLQTENRQTNADFKFIRSRKIEISNSQSFAIVNYTTEGIPFITAKTDMDLFYTQGYIVTENRLWQMEFWRRLMTGTLSEVFGNDTLDIDISFRRMNFLQVCEENVLTASVSTVSALQAYINGANAFLSDMATNTSLVPPEFHKYGCPIPTSYNVVDCFLFVKALSLGLAGNAGSEIGNQNLIDMVGLKRWAQFNMRDLHFPYIYPPYYTSPYAAPPESSFLNNTSSSQSSNNKNNNNYHMSEIEESLIEEVFKKEVSSTIMASRNHLKKFPIFHEQPTLLNFFQIFPQPEMSMASNNWVIGGQHSPSTYPILCNDPHLAYFAPNIWILVGLDVEDESSKFQNLIGATIVFAPGIGIGRNNYISWGYTTDKADSQDLFIMSNNDNNTAYSYKGNWVEYETSTASIDVKGQSTVTVELYFSVYGPTLPNPNGNYYSVKWAALDAVETSFDALLLSNTASSLSEWRHAMSYWNGLLFNGAYSDIHNNIAMQVTGRIPIRVEGDLGNVPKPGDGSYDWLGYIPWDDMPFVANPKSGFLVSANNLIAPPSMLASGYLNNYYQPPSSATIFNDNNENHQFEIESFLENYKLIPGDYDVAMRAQRIVDLIYYFLNTTGEITPSDMHAIQGDRYTIEFKYLYPSLSILQLTNSTDLQLYNQLLAWDGVEDTTSFEAVLFERWVECLSEVTIGEIGTATTNPVFLAHVFNNASPDGSGDDVSCSFTGLTCLEYASQCFESAVSTFEGNYNEEYGTFHKAVFVHLPPLPVYWNRAISVGGNKFTPNACTFTIDIPDSELMAVLGGPSFRMIADMSNTNPTQIIMPMGENGNPKSEFYDNLLTMWDNVEYLNLDWPRSPL